MKINSNQNIIDELNKCVLFKQLSKESIRFIAEYFEKEIFGKNEVILKEGMIGEKIFIIQQGCVEIQQGLNCYLSPKLYIFEPGAYFGELALMSDKDVIKAQIVSLEETTVCLTLQKNQFNSIIKSNPKIALEICKQIYQRDHEKLGALKGDLINALQSIVTALGLVAEYRDPETGRHINRVSEFARELAKNLMNKPGFDIVDSHFVELITLSSVLHDIGKVGVPDAILRKPGKLDAKEWIIMKNHTIYGGEVIEKVLGGLNYPDFLRMGKNIAIYHQEFWDGHGYPYGLKGKNIPLEARIMAVVDIYDALRSERSYKESMTHQEARKIIVEKRGNHLDPDMVDAFLEQEKNFEKIFIKLHD